MLNKYCRTRAAAERAEKHFPKQGKQQQRQQEKEEN